MWVLQLDLLLLAALLGHLVRSRASPLRPLSPAAGDEIVQSIGPTVRALLSIFYFAAAFWKVNHAFLDARYSCAPVFLMQQLDFLPFDLPDAAVSAIASLAPAAVLTIEFAVPAALLLGRRPGVLAVLALHLVIAICPPPNNIGCFGVATCSRLFLLVPDETSAFLAALPSRPRTAAAAVAAAAALLALTQSMHPPGSPVDLAVPYLFLLGATYALALRSPPPPRPSAAPLRLAHVAVGAVYALGLPALGGDMGTPNMFSNLRMHGGSNHLIAPTALLHRWLHAAPAADGTRGAFAGGLVRVEASTLRTLNAMYPGDLSGSFSARTRRRLQQVGHHPGFFVPMTGRTAALDPGPPFVPHASPLGEAFVPYTLRALELRRLLAEARRGGEPFSLAYSRLPGAEGDEAWRATARDGPQVRVSDDGVGGRNCTAGGRPCAEDELARLPEPAYVAQRLMFSKPYPILEGWSEHFLCSE
ncbi:hypothetical protein AB1Y20_013084 [Prymnesium parvum]|uniref:HTTM domain-containing protein n=1 Tax=Prymnesium parvum TaxID=97485 RepID=A0AB34IMB4_PRYPA